MAATQLGSTQSPRDAGLRKAGRNSEKKRRGGEKRRKAKERSGKTVALPKPKPKPQDAMSEVLARLARLERDDSQLLTQVNLLLG